MIAMDMKTGKISEIGNDNSILKKMNEQLDKEMLPLIEEEAKELLKIEKLEERVKKLEEMVGEEELRKRAAAVGIKLADKFAEPS